MTNEYPKSQLIVESILSHRKHVDKNIYEYNVKLKNNLTLPWVPEYFLLENQKEMLNNYKQKHGLNIISELELSNRNKEDNNVKVELSEGYGYFNFNEKLGIKVEIGLYTDQIDDINIYNNNELLSPKIKTENDYSEDVNLTDNQISTYTSEDMINILEKRMSDEIIQTINNITNNEIIAERDLNELYHCNGISKINNDIHKIPNISNNSTTDTTNRSDILQTKQLIISSELDIIDEAFSKLPFSEKIKFDVVTPDSSLRPPLPDKLKLIIENGDVEQLQAYLSSTYSEIIKSYFKNNSKFLPMASKFDHIHIVVTLLSIGVDINSLDLDGNSALKYACDNENCALIDLLINNGATLNLKKDGTNNILFQCLTNNKSRSISTLLNLGANFSQINLEWPFSLDGYAKQMKLDVVRQIVENHIACLYTNICDIAQLNLGSNIKIIKPVMPIYVLSTSDIQGTSWELNFNASVPPTKPNCFNMLFLITGLVLGTGMKCFMDYSNKIIEIHLNGIKQQSIIPDNFFKLSSFSPLMKTNNHLQLWTSNVDKLRKLRLILVACEVLIIE